MKPAIKVKRKTYTMRLDQGLVDEARRLNIDVQLMIEWALRESITAVILGVTKVSDQRTDKK